MNSNDKNAPDRHSPSRERKSRGPWLVLLSTTSLGIAILASFVCYRYLASVALPIQPEDRTLLVTAQDLLDFDPDLVVRTDVDTITKIQQPDGTIKLDYRYAGDDSSGAISIHCRVVTAVNRSDARQRFEALTNSPIALASSQRTKLRWQTDDASFASGDQSSFGKIVHGGDTVGVVFVSRIGHQIFSLRLEGIVVDSYGDLSLLTAGPLRSLEERK